MSGSTNVVQPGMGGLRLSQTHAFLSVPSQYPETIQNFVVVAAAVVVVAATVVVKRVTDEKDKRSY